MLCCGSDCDAVKTMMVRGEPGANPSYGHAYSLNGAMAVQDGVRAGCDSNCGDPYHVSGAEAIDKGLVTEAMLNASVRRLLRPMFQLGLFDPPGNQSYTHYNWSHVGTAAHQQLALEAAQQSLVLLQNPAGRATMAEAVATETKTSGGGDGTPGSAGKGILPLAKGRKVLVAGPLYDATTVLQGNYNGAASPMQPLWKWIANASGAATTTTSAAVHDPCSNDTSGIDAVVAATKGVESVVLVLGACLDHEGEGRDRKFLHLPGAQRELYTKVAAAIKAAGNTAELVVVLIMGGPVSIDEIKSDGSAAVIQAGFPGQSGGQAITQALFGDINPSGKLTTTIYKEAYVQGEPILGKMPWMDSQIRPHAGFPAYPGFPAGTVTEGRTHMYYTGTPLFGFGFGLSYTSFSLDWENSNSPSGPLAASAAAAPLAALSAAASALAASPSTNAPAPSAVTVALANIKEELPAVSFNITVTNTGGTAGKETVMAFWSPPAEVDALLKQELFDFQGVYLEPGASETLTIHLPKDPAKIATVTEDGDRVFLAGAYRVTFSRGHGVVLTTTVNVVDSDSRLGVGEGEGKSEGGLSKTRTPPVVLSEFPSRFVEGHEVGIEACLEGTSDVVSHTESFLVDYKRFTLDAASGHIRHGPSGYCLARDAETTMVRLQSCVDGAADQAWTYDAKQRTITQQQVSGAATTVCLSTAATDASMLRVNVTASSSACAVSSSPSAQWTFDAGEGFLRSGVAGLCLAAQSQGVFGAWD